MWPHIDTENSSFSAAYPQSLTQKMKTTLIEARQSCWKNGVKCLQTHPHMEWVRSTNFYVLLNKKMIQLINQNHKPQTRIDV